MEALESLVGRAELLLVSDPGPARIVVWARNRWVGIALTVPPPRLLCGYRDLSCGGLLAVFDDKEKDPFSCTVGQ